MKAKIKRIVRNLPETNSSSSHSVVIDDENLNYDRNYWNFPMDDEGNIHIPNRSFGREKDKFNTALEKTQYTCGLISSWNVRERSMEYLERLRNILIQFTGANDVIFDWLDEFYSRIEEIEERDKDEFKYIAEDELGPDIDHQSLDLYVEVLESDDTMRDFIFNSNSWLFLADDGDEHCDEYAMIKKESRTDYVQVFLPEPIGRIDHEVTDSDLIDPSDVFSSYDKKSLYHILTSIYFDNTIPGTPPMRLELGIEDSGSSNDKKYKHLLFFRGIVVHEKTADRVITPIRQVYWSTNEFDDAYNEVLSNDFHESFNKLSSSGTNNSPSIPSAEQRLMEMKEKMPDSIIMIDYKILTEEFGYV